jgi:hypothetical protein
LRSVANRGGESGELGAHRGTFREKGKGRKSDAPGVDGVSSSTILASTVLL